MDSSDKSMASINCIIHFDIKFSHPFVTPGGKQHAGIDGNVRLEYEKKNQPYYVCFACLWPISEPSSWTWSPPRGGYERPGELTGVVMRVGDDKHLQRLLVPLFRFVRDVEALLPHAAVEVVELQQGVHIQHLKGKHMSFTVQSTPCTTGCTCMTLYVTWEAWSWTSPHKCVVGVVFKENSRSTWRNKIQLHTNTIYH